MKRIMLLVALVFWLAGCSTIPTMKGGYSSEVDPEFKFSKNLSIAVLPSKKGNVLKNKQYVSSIISELKKLGFESVYSYKRAIDEKKYISVLMIINVSRETKSYQYQAADYGMVDSGRTTTNCTGYGYSLNCTKNKHKTFGVTGYSPRTGYSTGYYFSANLIDLKSEEKIMFVFGSSFVRGCSERGAFEFLIPQTIKRLNFKKPSDYKYSIRMPEGYNCNY
jgi:hypothetical protein